MLRVGEARGDIDRREDGPFSVQQARREADRIVRREHLKCLLKNSRKKSVQILFVGDTDELRRLRGRELAVEGNREGLAGLQRTADDIGFGDNGCKV